MNKLSKNENGFSVVEIMLVVVVIVLVGTFGYFIYKKHNNTSTQNNNSAKCPAGEQRQYSVSPNEPNNTFCVKDGVYTTT